MECPECGSRNLFLHGLCNADEHCCHKRHLATCNDRKVLYPEIEVNPNERQ